MEKGIANQKQKLRTSENIEIPLPFTLTNYNNQTFTISN